MHLDANGTRLWFDVDGAALVPDGAAMRMRPTVVLLHGGPGSYDHSYFKPDFGRLGDVAQVVYLDLRGHGRSEHGDPDGWSFEACADDVAAFCDALGIERPIVLGHSLGGLVALVYGLRHPEHPAGLVLQSTYARFDLDRLVEGIRGSAGDEVADIARRTYSGDRTVTDEEWARVFPHFGPWVPGAEEQARKIVNPELRPRGFELMTSFDVLHRLTGIRAPTLVCVGAVDNVTPVAAAEEIVDALPEGIARLEVIADAGHWTWRDNPDAYWPVLAEFVREAGAS
jgi:pimeloyl-ACP methyl ester carboxylesterase